MEDLQHYGEGSSMSVSLCGMQRKVIWMGIHNFAALFKKLTLHTKKVMTSK